MLFNFNQSYDINTTYNVDDNIYIDEITKKDLIDNFIDNNCDLLHFRDLEDQHCIAQITDYDIIKNQINIKCDIYMSVEKSTTYKKGKYEKVNFSLKRKLKLINELGILESQLAHSTEIEEYEYIAIEVFFRNKLNYAMDMKLYELNLDGDYEVYRHKNLFSEYRDEISDFEKMTFLLKEDMDSNFFLGHKLDSNILEYNHELKTLEQRKEARNLAKSIYQNPNGFSKKEVLNLLKNKNLFVKISTVIDKNDKRAYYNINLDDMNEYTLSRKQRRNKAIKNIENTPYYTPHRLVKKQRRYIKRRQIKEGLNDYLDEVNQK